VSPKDGSAVRSAAGERRSFRGVLPTLSMLVLVLLFLFAARIIYAPMLVNIERSMSLTHTQAATFFLFVTIGYSGCMVFSGFVAARLTHRWTILLSVVAAVAALGFIAASDSLAGIRVGLVFLGAGAGLYFPSGVPTLTSLVDPRDEGKAMAVHEVGPNLGFVATPIVASLLLSVLSWRRILLVVGAFGILTALAFLAFARGGRFRGEPPRLANARPVLRRSSFWITAAMFALGAGAGVGVFSIIPTYLVVEKGMDQGLVNTLVGISRVSGLGVIFVVGFLVDRTGVRWIMAVLLLLCGLSTAAMGLGSRGVLLAAMFVQPILVAGFFPAGFVAASRITSRRLHNVTLSFLLPIGYGFGAGLVPLFLGILGDHNRFALGFAVYGGLLTAASLLPFLLRLEEPGDQSSRPSSRTALPESSARSRGPSGRSRRTQSRVPAGSDHGASEPNRR
jgi:NNP family nitrate/nitrite transporter-like MFS transporter